MAKVNKNIIQRNLKKWLEITDLCLNLRLAYLKKYYSEREAKKKLFKEIIDYKESKWTFKKKSLKIKLL